MKNIQLSLNQKSPFEIPMISSYFLHLYGIFDRGFFINLNLFTVCPAHIKLFSYLNIHIVKN